MSRFLRLLNEGDKAQALAAVCSQLRQGGDDPRHFEVNPESFDAVPGKPFAYWVSDVVRKTFTQFPSFNGDGRTVRVGMQTGDDFRFVRTHWEISESNHRWRYLAKGGSFSRFFADISVMVNWKSDGLEVSSIGGSVIRNSDYYGRPGLTWPLRGITFSAQAVPANSLFSVAGKMAFSPDHELETWLAIFNSHLFDYLVRLFAGKVGGVQYEVGLIAGIPVAAMSNVQALQLSGLARRGWLIKRVLASSEEKSHAFLLPAILRSRLNGFDPQAIETELARIQSEIDAIVFELYGFSEADRQAVVGQSSTEQVADGENEEDEEEGVELEAPPVDALLSWATGVAFGRFDWRLASGERQAPPDPNPFDPLPAKSPGMLPNGSLPFHPHGGILVDEQGHPHDLVRLVEEVLEIVNVPVSEDVRRWLQKDFFAFHLRRYSKSRRKAPIYWPLATASGSYTLWLYYPSLSDQTLFTAVNDFIDPKLKDVRGELETLRGKGPNRSRQEEKQLDSLLSLEHELGDLRDSLLEIAPSYRPNQDDGVQITAAPLWKLFRFKPWQKVLKDTWAKLEKGDYDWARLAMNYWPDRVSDKCITDKSLAIAHELDHLYTEPEPKLKAAWSRKKAGSLE